MCCVFRAPLAFSKHHISIVVSAGHNCLKDFLFPLVLNSEVSLLKTGCHITDIWRRGAFIPISDVNEG